MKFILYFCHFAAEKWSRVTEVRWPDFMPKWSHRNWAQNTRDVLSHRAPRCGVDIWLFQLLQFLWSFSMCPLFIGFQFLGGDGWRVWKVMSPFYPVFCVKLGLIYHYLTPSMQSLWTIPTVSSAAFAALELLLLKENALLVGSAKQIHLLLF